MMIAYDVDYYNPTTIEEATQLFHRLVEEGKKPVYYAGGTEIITLARSERLDLDAIINIKSIHECLLAYSDENEITLGAALSLTQVIKTNFFPLLNQTIAQIADQTSRNQITLGGNICGDIFYREAALPFLITESKAVIANRTGIKEYPFKSIFNQKLQLSNEDLLVQLKVKKNEVNFPFYTVKKRKQWDVGYPLITVAAVKKKEQLKVAFSGLCNFPFHDVNIDKRINDPSLTAKERLDGVLNALSSPVLSDVHGSMDYRHFVLKNLLQEVVDAFKGAKT